MTDDVIQKPDAILIAGPTASGKTATAIEVAKKINGIVINTDSMQIYDGLRVLTARPTEQEEAQAPHRLYGVQPPEEPSSVAHWLTLVQEELQLARKNGQTPIFTGGTGLYFKSLIEGLTPTPDVPLDVRDHWQAVYDEIGGQAFFDRLKAEDPALPPHLKPEEPQRLVRAMSVLKHTGKSLYQWQQEDNDPPVLTGRIAKFILMPDRDWLYDRCNRRFDLMLDAGAMNEVDRLLAMTLPPTVPVMKAVGVPQLIAAKKGDLSLEEAIANAKQETRRYAKRQSTWFRNQFIAWNMVSTQQMEKITSKIFSKIRF